MRSLRADARRWSHSFCKAQSHSFCKAGLFNDFIKDDFIPEGDGQVASGSVSLSDPVVLETEEQMLEREQNERVVLESIDKTHVMVVTYCSKRHRSSLSLVVVNGITLMTEPY